VHVDTLRQLVLVEVEGDGGPIEMLLNNTKWDGTRDDTGQAIPGSQPDPFGVGNFLTELPRVGSTEVWEIANLSEDAHPIHVHLVQFQLINRQDLAKNANDELVYRATYDAASRVGCTSRSSVHPARIPISTTTAPWVAIRLSHRS
jgi:spore coat protein A